MLIYIYVNSHVHLLIKLYYYLRNLNELSVWYRGYTFGMQKMLIILSSCIICTPNFWAEKSGKIMSYVQIITILYS